MGQRGGGFAFQPWPLSGVSPRELGDKQGDPVFRPSLAMVGSLTIQLPFVSGVFFPSPWTSPSHPEFLGL